MMHLGQDIADLTKNIQPTVVAVSKIYTGDKAINTINKKGESVSISTELALASSLKTLIHFP